MTHSDVLAAARARLTPRRVAIRHKLGAAMLVPVAMLTLVVVIESVQVTRDAARVRRQSALAAAADGPGGLLRSLQDERNWAAVELIGQGGLVTVDVEGYDETRRRTDSAIEGFVDGLGGSDRARAVYRPALASLGGLDALRSEIDAFGAPRTMENAGFGDEMFAGYTDMIVPFLDAVNTIAAEVDDPELRQGAGLLATSSEQVEVVGNLARKTLVYSLFTDGGVDTPQEIFELSDLNERLKQNEATLELNTTGLYKSEWDKQLFRVFTWKVVVHVGRAISTGTVDLEAFLDVVTVPADKSYFGYRQRVGRIVQAQADSLEADAAARQRLYLGLLLVIVGLTAASVWVTTRSIARPLLSLARQTSDMAHHHLPDALSDVLRTPVGDDLSVPPKEPIQVASHGEIGRLADVLNRAQDSAIDLAVGQAVLRRNLADALVNLGRRNQNLLLRQLALITELERDEANPTILTNLFQLDHLATRMRRNAESLLVLGELPPVEARTQPVRMTDIIRAALGEVEDFHRVKLDVEPGVVVGGIAADLTHLLAELVENALLFSAPQEWVRVRGHRVAAAAGYTVAILDSGLGMSAEDLADANRRLAGTESFTVAPSKYLGHYVSGNLARRHGIRVHLGPSPSGGVTATVDLPDAVLVPDAPPPTPSSASGGAGVS